MVHPLYRFVKLARCGSEPCPADSKYIHVLTAGGELHTLGADTLKDVAPPVSYTPVSHGDRRQRNTHAALTSDERIMLTNTGSEGAINIIDLEARSSRLVPVTDLLETWDVAINHVGPYSGLVAVHGRTRVAVYSLDDTGSLRLSGSALVPPQSVGAWDIPPFENSANARVATLAWTGSGDAVVAAVGQKREYRVFEMIGPRDHLALRRRSDLDSCMAKRGIAMQLDVLTLNGVPTPTPSPTTPPPSLTPSPTASAPATETPSATAPPTRTPTPTSTQTVAASPTAAPPAPIFLPILLRESCTPDQQRADVVLVVDASTSMLETTAAGRSKLAAAIAAAGTFLDQLRLDAGDQAAIVSFNADADLRTELTADRPTLDTALASITPASQTCLVCGVDVAATELASDRRRADNTPVLILLTDGLSNPRPASEAVQRAAEAKAAGVVIHTIGLGDTLDFGALEAMASEPDDFHRAPDAEDLAAIYAQIAVEIPCPPSRYWGRR